jgi:hypothetical protein
MDQKIQLKHQQRKKAVKISKEKYDRLTSLLVAHLRNEGQSTLGDVAKALAKGSGNAA